MTLTGNIFDYFIVFAAGVLVSFTPCVYPVIPLTASLIAGANTSGKRLTGFVLSLIYVLGMALTYLALGSIAVLTGTFFGHLQLNPYMFGFVGISLIVFALIMIDIIRIPILNIKIQNQIKPKNFFSILLFGAISGLVIGPCTTPILGTLLIYVASKQNFVHAMSLLFVFSYGVGFSLILVGTFSGFLARMPKSGRWLIYIKRGAAVILCLAGVYYLLKSAMLFQIF